LDITLINHQGFFTMYHTWHTLMPNSVTLIISHLKCDLPHLHTFDDKTVHGLSGVQTSDDKILQRLSGVQDVSAIGR
jgi:hypothetical protein